MKRMILKKKTISENRLIVDPQQEIYKKRCTLSIKNSEEIVPNNLTKSKDGKRHGGTNVTSPLTKISHLEELKSNE